MQKLVLGITALTVAALGGMTNPQMAPMSSITIPVVDGAKALTTTEKGGVDGGCGCGSHDTKPGYGFGTTGHYGPPGQGFTPHKSWRQVVRKGGTTTPKGNDLPPTAFK